MASRLLLPIKFVRKGLLSTEAYRKLRFTDTQLSRVIFAQG